MSEYRYFNSTLTWANRYLWPVVLPEIRKALPTGRIFEIGCGNGATAGMLMAAGYDVTGVDTSESGIGIARSAYPRASLHVASAYDDLAARFGRFPLVLSLEVVEHLYDPRAFARRAFDLLEPGGTAIISTPFHGYWKNLALAVTGKMDAHFGALWDGGHIKFWSERTLRALLREAGFQKIRFHRAGRIRPLAKSMIAISEAPKSNSH